MKLVKKIIRVGDSKAIILPKDIINGFTVGDLIELDIKEIKKFKKNAL